MMRNIFGKVFSKTSIIITLLIGVAVGIVSFRIEDAINRQRYLELLQVEIRSNYLSAVDISNRETRRGSINNYSLFSTSVYQAGLQSGYILTIPLELQSEMYSIYTTGIPEINGIIDHQTALVEQKVYEWELCVLEQAFNPDLSCSTEENSRKMAENIYSELLAGVASGLADSMQNLSDGFNPTQDRLNSPFLSLLIGKQQIGILK